MITRTTRRLTAAVAVGALLLAACGDDDGDSSSDTTEAATDAGDDAAAETTEAADDAAGGEPIQIAALTSLTGNFAPWGIQVEDGMQLAVDEINAEGGVDGRQLELVVADDQSVAEEGISQLERLVEDGVVAVGGIISSDVGLVPVGEDTRRVEVPDQARRSELCVALDEFEPDPELVSE